MARRGDPGFARGSINPAGRAPFDADRRPSLEQVDALALAKASQAISSELDLGTARPRPSQAEQRDYRSKRRG